MGNYSVGLKTREKILQTAKELFYEKGYNKTTYSDICNTLGISQGTFHHHYKSKDQLAKIIHSQSYDRNSCEFDHLLEGDNNNVLWSIMCNRLYWYKFFADRKFRRFFLEIKGIVLNATPEEYFNTCIKDLLYPKELNPNDDALKLNIASFAGIDLALPVLVNMDMERYDFLTIAKYEERMAALLFDFEPESYDIICKKADEIIQQIDLEAMDTRLG